MRLTIFYPGEKVRVKTSPKDENCPVKSKYTHYLKSNAIVTIINKKTVPYFTRNPKRTELDAYYISANKESFVEDYFSPNESIDEEDLCQIILASDLVSLFSAQDLLRKKPVNLPEI